MRAPHEVNAMLKRLSLVTLLGLFCAVGPVTGQEPAEKAPIGPRIEVDATEIDLGAISRGEKAEAKFTLRNTGDQTLKILKAKPG
jgi:hypothetical protein